MDPATAILVSKLVTEGITTILHVAKEAGVPPAELEAAVRASLDRSDATWHRIHDRAGR